MDSNSLSGSSLGSVRVQSFTFFCIFGSMKYDSRASYLAQTFASPCFGRKPKARVATITKSQGMFLRGKTKLKNVELQDHGLEKSRRT